MNRLPISSTFIGAVAWLLAWVTVPGSLIVRLFLLAPLVVVPALSESLPLSRPGGLGVWPVLIAALALIPAFAIEAGPTAVALAVPWLVVVAALGTRAAWPLQPRDPMWCGSVAALAFLGVGAAFLLLDRLGAGPLAFPATIVLLTAVHFHFAGFGLGVLLLHAIHRGPTLAAAFIALAAGMAGTAAGFTVAEPVLSAIGAVLVACAGLALGLDLLVCARSEPGFGRRVAAMVAGAALLVGMPLGVGWAVATAAGVAFLPLELMVRTHGALNATAIVIGSLLASGPRR